MIKNCICVLLVFISAVSFAQKKERLSGSKEVLIQKVPSTGFNKLLIEDKFEVYLVPSDSTYVEIEADDNLHDDIQLDLEGDKLHIYASKNFARFKKLLLRIGYNKSLNEVVVKNDVVLNILEVLKNPEISIETYDYTKLYMNFEGESLTLKSNNKSQVELNSKAKNTSIVVSDNVNIKALLNSKVLNFDMYQRTTAAIEGDVDQARLRFDNNSAFTGSNLTVKNLEVSAEHYCKASVFASENVVLELSGKSELNLFGKPKVTLNKFEDSALLQKK